VTVHHRKLKLITFDLAGTQYQTQLRNWNLTNDTDDPEQFHTYGGEGESFAEEADPSWNLELEFYSDWRNNGISDFLTARNGETLSFQIDHHPDIVGEHTRRAGSVLIKAPSVGGEVRTTELTETTLAVIGEPTYERIG
jgi:hypothetical protein